MKCPSCDCHDTRVIDSRETADDSAVRRRRQCVACGKRFTTYERWERPDLRVKKRDGRVEDFDRDKLEVGVLKACEKRPIPRAALAQLIDDVEEELRSLDVDEVPSTEIGSLVLEKLKTLDPVAYLRFASVYRAFQDVSHFEKELRHLRQETLTEVFEKAPEERGAGRDERHGRKRLSG
jgi:transcriptional repressor NrdR